MMYDLQLLAQTEKLPTWLTPFWILSVGVLIGLVLVAIALGLMYLLSVIPGVGTLIDKPKQKRVVGAILSVVLLGGSLYWILPASINYEANESAWQGIEKLILLLLIAIPGSVIVSFSIIAMCARKSIVEIPVAIKEGALYWFTIICSILAGFAILGVLLSWVNGFGVFVIVRDPLVLLESYPRTFVTGEKEYEFVIPKSEDSDELIDLSFDGTELRSIQFQTNEELMLATEPINEDLPFEMIIRIPEKREGEWVRFVRTSDPGGPIPEEQVEGFHVRNMGDGPASLKLVVDTSPINRETRVITTVAICVFCVYMIYFMFRALFPKISAVALSTFKTEVAQGLFTIIMVLTLAFMGISIFIPYNTFGEDIKMLKDSGLTIILVAGIFVAVWAASKSVAEEIEGRTALTVLSKPIARREFILGKFVGIAWAVGLLFLVLGLGFLLAVGFKPIYDAREVATGDVVWQMCFQETMQIVPGLVLVYMETLVFVAISIAISTRLSIMANFPICLAIYVLGHLTPLMVQSSVAIEAFEGVVFIGQLIATVIPVLDHFNIQAAVAGGSDVPVAYLGYSLIYCVIYGTIAMLLALIMFEDRDLA